MFHFKLMMVFQNAFLNQPRVAFFKKITLLKFNAVFMTFNIRINKFEQGHSAFRLKNASGLSYKF